MLDVLQALRPVFGGKIIYGFQRIVDPAHLPYFDFLILGLDAQVSAVENANLSVGMLKSRYLTKIGDLADYELPTSKPVFWNPLVQSQHEFFVSGWVEDGFCVNNCEQRTYATDYSIQALGIEAVLEAVASQTRFQTAGFALNASYWHADVVMPSPGTTQAAFPNISQTIRNKPAEAIVKHWFGSDCEVDSRALSMRTRGRKRALRLGGSTRRSTIRHAPRCNT